MLLHVYLFIFEYLVVAALSNGLEPIKLKTFSEILI